MLALQQRQQQLLSAERSSSSVFAVGADNTTSSLNKGARDPEQAEQLQRFLQQWQSPHQSQQLIKPLLNAHHYAQPPASSLRDKQSSTSSRSINEYNALLWSRNSHGSAFNPSDALPKTPWNDFQKGQPQSTSQQPPPPEPDTKSKSVTKISDRSSNSSCFMGFGGPMRQLKRAHSLRESGTSSESNGSSNSAKRHRLLEVSVDRVNPSDTVDEAKGFCLSVNSTLDREINKALLHHSCRLYAHDLSIVQCALELDPAAIRQAANTECPCRKNLVIRTTSTETPLDDNHSARSVMSEFTYNSNITDEDECSGEVYKYPINIALKHNAPVEVVQLLAQKAPDVLALSDGPEQCGSLSIFLQHCRYSSSSTAESNAQIVQCLINASREAASVLDRRHNTPLHYAVRAAHNLPQVALQQIYSAFPAALQHCNFHGQSPVDLAIRASVPVAVVDWLQTLHYKQLDQESEQAMELVDCDLDRSLRKEFMLSSSCTAYNPENDGYFF